MPTASVAPAIPASSTSLEVTSSVPDPWMEAVLSARNPIAVGYGFPDGTDLDPILFASAERKIDDCMAAAGFVYEPEIDDRASGRNAAYQNALPVLDRQRYNLTLFGPGSGSPDVNATADEGDGGCWSRAQAATYIGNADPEGVAEIGRRIRDDPAVRRADAVYAECAGRSLFDSNEQPPPEECAQLGGLVDEAMTIAQREADRAYVLTHRDVLTRLVEQL